MSERINISALLSGVHVELPAEVTHATLLTGAPYTVIEFPPDTPPMQNGDSFTITTVSETSE